MNGHPEYLELIAASIDFDLTDEEFGRLNYHLTRCPECRRAAEELRGDAAAVAAYPAPRLAPARSEQILRAALRTPPARPRWGMLAVAAMLTALGGGLLFAGYQVVKDDDPAPAEPPPSLVAEASVPPSAEPTAEDTAEPGAPDGGDPPAIDVPEPTPTDPDLGAIEFEFPRPYSAAVSNVRVAPVGDGRVWVSFEDGDGSVLALLDERGAGEPARIPGSSDCTPVAIQDGSVRLLCYPGECIDTCSGDVVYAYTPTFDELPGFPAYLDSLLIADRHHARAVGTSVVLGALEYADEDIPSVAHLVTVKSDGSVSVGFPLEEVAACCVISPDGIAFGTSVESHDDGTQTTTLSSLGPDGLVPGWPLPLPGTASVPAFGPNGDLYVSSWVDTGSQIIRVRDGTPVSTVDIEDAITWDPSFDGPLAPLVDGQDRTRVVADGTILALDSGVPMDGFPYEPATGLAERGNDCGQQDTGCQGWTEPPVMGPRGLVYAIESAPAEKGERMTVINPDGSVRSGWPKTLQRPGATWDSVTIGENRIAYAVAIEPEPNKKASISILAFAPNGSREWIRTLVEP